MSLELKGKKVAILATDGFEKSELELPRAALQQAGAQADIVSPEKKPIKSWDKKNFGPEFDVNEKLSDVSADDYDALLLPGRGDESRRPPDDSGGGEVCPRLL